MEANETLAPALLHLSASPAQCEDTNLQLPYTTSERNLKCRNHFYRIRFHGCKIKASIPPVPLIMGCLLVRPS